MLRTFINLFLSLILPIGTLFSAIGILYYLKDFELTKAMRLGVISGVLLAIALSLLLSLIILVKRTYQIYRYQKLHNKEHIDLDAGNIVMSNKGHDPLLPKKEQSRYMFLMDYDVAFEVALYAIEYQKIGVIQKTDKHHGEIVIRQRGKNILLRISRLSLHTSQLIIDHMDDLEYFISEIKEKEFAFLDYQ